MLPWKHFVILSLVISSHTFSHAADQRNEARERASEEWNYSLALQAATYGAPLVTMYALRQNDAIGAKAKARPNTIWRMEDISTPELSKEAGYVTPNVNTIYGFGFMDLEAEPIILEVPDSNGLYYMVEIVDMWTNAFAYVGGKATGYEGGIFALVGPGWKGDLPVGIKTIDTPTPWVLLQPRVHIYADGKVDLERAKKVLQGIKTTGLAQFNGKLPLPEKKYNYITPEKTNAELPVSLLDYRDPLQFWELFVLAMNENPPPQDQVAALVPMFAPLGIEIGKPWDRTKLSPKILEVMKKVAAEIGSILAALPVGQIYQGAFIPPNIGDFKTDYRTRAVIGRMGLTANTPFEAVYWMYGQDSKGNTLTGANKYTMTFKEEIPYFAPGFWSITMYDSSNNYTVPNILHRYMLGSDSKDLKKNPDGSFVIYIQHENPGKDKESNWLPTPEGEFYLIPRSYAPKPQIIDLLENVNAWPVPGVVKI